MKFDRPIRLGVIGLGAVAQSAHLPLLRRRPELFDVVAVADVAPALAESVGARYGIEATHCYTDPQRMLLRDDIDAVLICSGGSHAPLVTNALEGGRYVLCEKPLAVTHAELNVIEAHLPLAGPPRLMVGYMKQYDPATVRARELLKLIDDVRSVDVRVLHPTGQSQLDFAHVLTGARKVPGEISVERQRQERELQRIAFGDDYRDENLWRAYAGCIMASLSHDMSVLRTILDATFDVDYAEIWYPERHDHARATGRDAAGLGENPPSIRAAGALSDELRFILDWHYLHDYPAYRETVTVVYGTGSLELAFPSPYLLHAPTILSVYRSDGTAESRTELRSIAESFEEQLVAFAAMVQRGQQPKTDIAGARDDIVTSQAIIRRFAERTGLVLAGEIGASSDRTAAGQSELSE